MQNDTLVAVDIAKEVFEVGISDRPGRVARRRRLARYEFLECFAQLPPATVVMEACGSAHSWARRIEELGHVVVLLPPQYVRPYVVRNKTNRTDVNGLLEAFRNEQIRSVPIKIRYATSVGHAAPAALGLVGGPHASDQLAAGAAAGTERHGVAPVGRGASIQPTR